MDNGQHGQIPTNQELFTDGITAGIGAAPENTNPLSPDNNLDLEDFESRNFGARGNTTLKSSTEEMPMPPSEIIPPMPNFIKSNSADTGELGKITKIPMPRLRGTTPDVTEQDHDSLASPNEIPTDPEIKDYVSNGKVNEEKLRNKINELSASDLAALVDFRNEACAAMQNSLKEPK